ncbi:MAG: molybdopterin-dependent oxidoreductase, partial [Polyangiaceae bacterium]|nr:molybdopterin-dependent oxidoreductase [Polyangiaceae bacterium]
RLAALRERGGKLVVIDPRRTETAKFAQRHLFIRPGTDALLLLALVRELFARGPVRLGAIGAHCRSLDELRAAVAPYAPERVAGRVGIDEETIRTIAKELADAESAVVYGRVGACTQEFGGITAWLINVLNLITGNFDRAGGVMFTKPAADIIGVANRGVVGKGSFGRFRSRVRGLPEFGGELPVAALAEEILEEGPGRIRALVTMAGNPVLSAPNGRRIDEALAKLDFMVSIDPYVNETTRHADVILPPTSPLEKAHYDLALHALAVRNTAKFSLPVFPRAAGALDDGEIASRIVEALETARHGAWSRPALTAKALRLAGAERMVDVILRLGPYRGRRGPNGRGLTLARLRREPHGIDLGPLEPCMPDRLPATHRFVDLAP